MAGEAADDAVDGLVRRADGETDEIERVARHRADGGAVGLVVPGREQVGRVDREAQLRATAPARRRCAASPAPAAKTSTGWTSIGR